MYSQLNGKTYCLKLNDRQTLWDNVKYLTRMHGPYSDR